MRWEVMIVLGDGWCISVSQCYGTDSGELTVIMSSGSFYAESVIWWLW